MRRTNLCLSFSFSFYLLLLLLHYGHSQSINDIVNVREFGAKGDGYSDDTNVFQTLLNLANDRIVIWIPNGTYMITGLTVKKDKTVVLIGEDQFTTKIRMHQSKLGSCSEAMSGDEECVMLWGFQDSSMIVTNATWDGDNFASSIFRHDNVRSVVLSNLVLQNANYAIHSTSTLCTEWNVTNCTFDKTIVPCYSTEYDSSSQEGFLEYKMSLIILIIIVAFVKYIYLIRSKCHQKKEINKNDEYLSTPFSINMPSLSLLEPNKTIDNKVEIEPKSTPRETTNNQNSQIISTYSFVNGSLPPGVSATGGQYGNAFNLAGLVIPTNSPRIDFGNTFFNIGNPARTNLILQSNSFSSSPWLKSTNGPTASLTVTANAGVFIDGSKNATQLVLSASGVNSNIQSQVQQIVSGLVVGQVYTASVYVQGTVGGETLVLQVQTAASPYTTLGYVGIIATTSWRQYSCTFLATTTSVYFGVGTNTSEAPLTNSPQGGGTVLIYGSQLEAGPNPSAFIPTLSSPVSRPSSLQRWFAPSSGLLIEPSRTNVVIYSNLFNFPPWKVVNDGATATITPNVGTSPSGQLCAQATFSSVSTAQIGAIQQLINGLTTGATYQASVWVRGINGGETLYLSVQLGTSPYTVLGSELISAHPFWQRFSCSFVSPGSSIYLGFGGNTTVAPLLPTLGGSILIFNAQVEQGAWPSSDIITMSSPLTRVADSISLNILPTVDTLNFKFSDGTMQSISVSPGTYTIPTNLNRAKISLITASSTPSVPITSLTFSTPFKYNNGYPFQVVNGDTWSSTWADDDVIYTQSCDSFNVWSPSTPTSNFCLSTLSEPSTSLTGYLVNSMSIFGHLGQLGPDGACWKANGTICIDGVLYMWVSRQWYGTAESGYIQTAKGGQLIKSSDHGVSWTPLPPGQALPFASPMFPTASFSAPEFIQFGGRDYQNNVVHNADQYVYAVSNDGSWNDGNYMILGRVGRSVIGNLSASDWQFYQGGDGSQPSNWGSVSSAYKIISGTKKCGLASAQYIPFCKRYIILQWYYPSIVNDGTDNVADTMWEIYESPTPWGPWNMIQTYEWNTEPGVGLYNPNVMPKSLCKDNGENFLVTTAGDYKNGAINNGDYTLTLVSLRVNN